MRPALVGDEHDAELTDDRFETAVGKRQGGGVRCLKSDSLGAAEFLLRDRQHGRVEVARHQVRCLRQGIAQLPGDNSGSRRDFENAMRVGCRNPSRQVDRIVAEQMRTEF